MSSIKNMLLGIAIFLLAIIVHLFIEAGLVTDFIAIIGAMLVILGYFSKENES